MGRNHPKPSDQIIKGDQEVRDIKRKEGGVAVEGEGRGSEGVWSSSQKEGRIKRVKVLEEAKGRTG